MFKLLSEIFLTLLISLIVVFGILYISFNLINPNNIVNTNIRKYALKYPLARSIFKLHQVGDARFDYADSNIYSQISINVFSQRDANLSSGVLDEAIAEMAKVVDKPSGIQISHRDLTVNIDEDAEDTDLRNLIIINRQVNRNQKSPLNIFVLSSYKPQPSLIGLVINDNSIFIFMDAIKNISENQNNSKAAEVSTILHEFAHLLGAEHTDSNNCILGNTLEDLSIYNLPTVIYDTYCREDAEKIKQALGGVI